MRIIIVRNYAPDKQYSMLAFADMLADGLRMLGHHVSVVAPPARLGKGCNSVHGLGKWLGYVDKYILAGRTMRSCECDFQPDVVHICDHSNAMYQPKFRSPVLLTCNDLLAIRTWKNEIPGQRKSFIGGLQQRWIFSWIRKARGIVCISEKTREELDRLAPETKPRSSVIPMGQNYPYRPIAKDETDHRLSRLRKLTAYSGDELTGPWMLHVGNNGWYKNRLGTLNIWKQASQQLNPQPGLVMVGDDPSEAMRESMRGVEDQVAFLRDVDNATLEALYNRAQCLLFPSLAEGFGWPPIEAQACGCPVVVSDIEPLRGNCPGALLIDPQEEESAARAMAELLASPNQIAKMKKTGLANAKRFTAESMVAAYVEQYQQLARA